MSHHCDSKKSEVLTFLALNQCTPRVAGEHFNIPFQTIYRWVNGQYVNDDVLQQVEDKKAILVKLLDDMAVKALEHAGSVLKDASYQQAMTGAAIAVDKSNLLRGDPTANENVKQTIEVTYRDRPSPSALGTAEDTV